MSDGLLAARRSFTPQATRNTRTPAFPRSRILRRYRQCRERVRRPGAAKRCTPALARAVAVGEHDGGLHQTRVTTHIAIRRATTHKRVRHSPSPCRYSRRDEEAQSSASQTLPAEPHAARQCRKCVFRDRFARTCHLVCPSCAPAPHAPRRGNRRELVLTRRGRTAGTDRSGSPNRVLLDACSGSPKPSPRPRLAHVCRCSSRTCASWSSLPHEAVPMRPSRFLTSTDEAFHSQRHTADHRQFAAIVTSHRDVAVR